MKKVVRFIIHSKAAAYIAALLYIAVWCCRSVLTGDFNFSGCLGLLLSLAAGYLSVKVAREFSLSDVKNVLPATLFYMGCTVAPQLNLVGGNRVHFILFSISCYILLLTYRNRSAMGGYFFTFVLIGIECLMSPSLLLALPWLVLCGSFMDSLHVRTFLAALWGLLCPFWIVCGVLFLTDRVGDIAPYFGHILPSELSMSIVLGDTQLWVPLLWALLLILPGSVAILFDRTMKLQANAGFRFVIVSLVVLLVAVCLSLEIYMALFPSVLISASLIGAGLFVTGEGRARNIYLLALFVLWLVALGLQVWSSFMMH